MKLIILAGGAGSRISEETLVKPKPLIEIGGKPILWHIMKIYSFYGINDFIICCGYKGYLIKEYFNNYFLHMSDVTFSMKDNTMQVIKKKVEPWKITLVDTGEDTNTGGRLKRVKDYVKKDNFFCFTYGDGVGNINISNLINFHKKHKKLVTVTATQPQARYGALSIDRTCAVTNFVEKPKGDGSWINGGFFVLSPKALDKISGDKASWEAETLTAIAKDKELFAYKHNGFWMPMDTMRDKIYLNNLWNNGKAPWKIWK
jgi:glucose-1-phosphate cytidylyltransferase